MAMTIPPFMGTADPQRPVPDPLGTTGILCLLAIFMISETCSVVLGWTTMSGVLWKMEASKPYVYRTAGSTE